MSRIIVPAATVFHHSGKPDCKDSRKAAEHLVQSGVDGILLPGSAGEFAELTAAEKRALPALCAQCVGAACPLYAGTGSTDFHRTLEPSDAAAFEAVRGLLDRVLEEYREMA